MANEAVKFGATQKFDMKPPQEKIFGVSIATVLNNFDCTGEARVQLSLPWLPGYTPWARIASQMAGMGNGSFFVPAVGTEVLVAFNHGDVREPYVLGSCWNTTDRPPALSPTDAITKKKIRTQLGHELSFDEEAQSVTLTSNMFATVTLNPQKAEISTPFATVTVGMTGDISISAKTKITLDAPIVEIKAKTLLSVQSNGAAELKASGVCAVQGSVVKIN